MTVRRDIKRVMLEDDPEAGELFFRIALVTILVAFLITCVVGVTYWSVKEFETARWIWGGTLILGFFWLWVFTAKTQD